jgi:hypothetical protein
MTILLYLLACAGDSSDDTGKGDDTDEVDTDTDTDADTDTDTDADTDTNPVDPATVPLDGECADDVHWGAFLVDSTEDYAYVTGSLSSGVVPVAVLTRVLDSGDCTIWRRENPFCDPTCAPGYTCDLTGECVPYPTTQDLGTVTLAGLSQAVTMEPRTPGFTYFDTSIPNPPWVEGDLLVLETSGGAFDPVTLYGVAPAPLVPVSLDWVITEGAPLGVAWDAPAGPVRTELVLTLRIDQHGTTPSSIECVFADDGAAEVPADVIETLMGFGVTGFPAGDLVRRTADSAPIGEGCIDLAASSSRLAHVEIEGYTPCTRDEDCPDGLTCNEPLERCE